jgi:hypothetical protein
MQLGFNTNFRYRGVLFHVQTEDSGTGNPHVITHLFHGGNIMASVKQDYSDLLNDADVKGAVRKLMESMHKTMLHQLSRGEHDAAISERLGADIFRAETDGASEPPTVTEEELPPARVEPTLLQPADLEPLPRFSNASSADSGPPAVQSRPAASPASSPPPSPAPAASSTPAAAGKESGSRLSKVFGDRVVSEKPLDEVVLDYLVENARKRKRQPK